MGLYRKFPHRPAACLIGIAALFCGSWCPQNSAPEQAGNNASEWLDPGGMTVEERIRVPRGFVRVPAAHDSFAAYLRRLPLKPHQTPVRLYNGRIKANRNAHDAVVDLAIGDKDLHQCADAVIRLRAEYLFREKQFNRIHFHLTNGFRMDYGEWRKGKRLVVHGNRTHWEQRRGPGDSEADFWKYLEVVFSYAGTLSLARELTPAGLAEMQIGDVFIQGGSPGHAVIVIDVAVDPRSGEKRFVLAQSYMPAQEIHVLRNPGDPRNSPWYGAGRGEDVRTPEWIFRSSDLKRFAEP